MHGCSRAIDHRSHSGAGFTLLEVAIAMSILGLILVTMMHSISAGLTLEYKAGRAGKAVLRARALMDELLTQIELRDGVEEEVDSNGLRWRRAVRLATPEEGGPVDPDALDFDSEYMLRHLEVVVAWSEGGGGEKTYTLETLRMAASLE